VSGHKVFRIEAPGFEHGSPLPRVPAALAVFFVGDEEAKGFIFRRIP